MRKARTMVDQKVQKMGDETINLLKTIHYCRKVYFVHVLIVAHGVIAIATADFGQIFAALEY